MGSPSVGQRSARSARTGWRAHPRCLAPPSPLAASLAASSGGGQSDPPPSSRCWLAWLLCHTAAASVNYRYSCAGRKSDGQHVMRSTLPPPAAAARCCALLQHFNFADNINGINRIKTFTLRHWHLLNMETVRDIRRVRWGQHPCLSWRQPVPHPTQLRAAATRPWRAASRGAEAAASTHPPPPPAVQRARLLQPVSPPAPPASCGRTAGEWPPLL